MEPIKTFLAELLDPVVLSAVLTSSLIYLILLILVYSAYIVIARPYMSTAGQKARSKRLLKQRTKMRDELAEVQSFVNQHLPPE